jgi:hypothetical protein
MALQNAIHERVDTWNKAGLEVGAKLTGYYVREEKFTSAAYGDGKKFIIADESGKEIAGVMAQAVIERAFMNIPQGSYVEITFKGKETTAKGQQVNAYDIQFDPEKTL